MKRALKTDFRALLTLDKVESEKSPERLTLVLIQEMDRFNRLIKSISPSLKQLHITLSRSVRLRQVDAPVVFLDNSKWS